MAQDTRATSVDNPDDCSERRAVITALREVADMLEQSITPAPRLTVVPLDVS